MTLYEAYKKLAIKRRIFTSIPLFDILQEEDKRNHDTMISPLKFRTHYAMNFCERTAYMFALYDMIHLDNQTDL